MMTDNRFIPIAIAVAIFLISWLAIVQLPQQVPSPQLDPSWASALGYFANFHYQFGTDVIFTFGPLGYLYTNYYSGFLLTEIIVFELALKAFIAFQFVTICTRVGKALGILLLLTILVSPQLKDYLFFFSITTSLITVSDIQRPPWQIFAALVFLSVVSLIKFSFLIASCFGLFAIIVFFILTRQWKALAFTTGAYATSFLLIWIAIGQRLPGIFAYLDSSLQIVTGYQKSMFHAGDSASLLVGLAILVLSLTGFFGLAWVSDKNPIRFVFAFLLSQSMLLSWKYGFLRADFYHIIQYYFFGQFALITAWAVLQPSLPQYRRPLLALIYAGSVLPVCGIVLGGAFYWAVVVNPVAWTNLKDNFSALSNFSGYRSKIAHRLAIARAKYALPKIKAHIGQESVDVFGFEQAIALLNDFDYQPRPVFQSYSAYNGFLVDVNRRYYRGARAPRFVLLKLQTIDNRFPAADDFGALETVLHRYAPVMAERGFLLFSRLENPDLAAGNRLLQEKTGTMNDPIELPVCNFPIWIQIDWDTSWHEKVRELAYQPSEVNIEISTRRGDKQTFRLIEPLARAGFLLSPVLFDTLDVLNWVTGRAVDAVKSFKLKATSSYFMPQFRYRLSALSKVPNRMVYPDNASQQLRYWVFDRTPSRVATAAPAGVTAFAESNVFMAPAPSEIVFDVPESAHFVEGSFGLQVLPSFLREVADRAEFLVEYLGPDRKTLELFHRRLIPEVNPDDRGEQFFRVTLPKNNGGQIRLRAIIPLDGHGRGNKTYWSDIRFK